MLEETPQFNGEMLSSGNLTYMRERSYDASIGQFTSKDTWLGRQVNPLSQNRNTFVENNPINAIDPSGRWPDWGGMWKAAGDAWNSGVETTKAVVNTVVHVVKETAQAVVQTVQNVVSTVTNAVSNAWNTATRWVGNA